MKTIETYEHKKNGYNPFLITPKWQVAQLNYAPEEALEAIDKLDIHFKTDEAFFLIEGDAVLIGATIDNSTINYELKIMQPGITYNIPQKVWHNIALYPGAKVLIIEDANTHLGDFEFHHLSKEQQDELQVKVKEIFKTQS